MRRIQRGIAVVAVVGGLLAASAVPAYASSTYTSPTKTCVETKTPQAKTPLVTSEDADYIKHLWTGNSTSNDTGWTSSKVYTRTTKYLHGRIGKVTAITKTSGVFVGTSTMTCVSNPV